MFSQLCVGVCRLLMIIFARFIVIPLYLSKGPVIINDRLIIVIFLGEGGRAQKMRRPHPHLGGGGFPKFCLVADASGWGREGVMFLGILCGRHKCMLPCSNLAIQGTFHLIFRPASAV